MILFTADWHIKLGQKNVPVVWAMERYYRFFEEIHDIEENVDCHIIGGDLFDRIPTMAELELYFDFIKDVKVHTIIFDGNHEATRKNKTFFTNLKEVTAKVNPLVQIEDSIYETDYFTILPYCELHRKNIFDELDTSKPLFTHVRGEIPPHVKPEIDLDLFAPFPVVFAGDLHAHSNCQRNIIYPGSPMTTSFHRNVVDTGYILIHEKESEDWAWEYCSLPLPQLIRKTVTDPADMIPTDFHHTIYEIQGDIQELAEIKNSELLDKKVVVRSSDASLILDKEMSIAEELHEYLQFILEIDEEKIPDIIGLFNDYTAKIEMG